MRALVLALLPLALAACQQGAKADHQAGDGEGHAHAPAAEKGEAARAYDESMAKMHRDMGAASEDADESFMRMMIGHHQGAIDMARIELKYGKDPEARRLAERVIAAQEAEIREIEAWLRRRQGPQPAKS